MAVEQDGLMFGICERVTRVHDVISCHHGNTREMGDIEVDVVVTETLDCIGIGEGIVDICCDIAIKSPRPVTFIPSSIAISAYPVHSSLLHRTHFKDREYRSGNGVDPGTPYCCEFIGEFPDVAAVCDPVSVLAHTLGRDLTPSITTLRFTCPSPCCVDGMVSFFTAHLAPGVSLTNSPLAEGAAECWEQGYHPLPRREFAAGQTFSVRVEITSTSLKMSWGKEEIRCLTGLDMRMLNSGLTSAAVNIIPKMLTPDGIVKCGDGDVVSFRGVVIHSDVLSRWCRVDEGVVGYGSIVKEVNRFQTIIHQGVPWPSLAHTALSEVLELKNGQVKKITSKYPSLSPTGLVFWALVTLPNGETFDASSEWPLWRPAAVIFPPNTQPSRQFKLEFRTPRGNVFASILS